MSARLGRWVMPVLAVAVAVVLVALPFAAPAGQITVADFVLAAIVGGLSLHVLTGMTGLISLGPAAFMGIGAYTTAAFMPHRFAAVDAALGHLPAPLDLVAGNAHGWPLVLGLVAAAAAGGVVALALVPIALRFRDLYLSIVTLGLLFVAGYCFVNWDGLTGGSQGLSFGAPAIGGFELAGDTPLLGAVFPAPVKLYYLWGSITAVLCLMLWRLGGSRTGRALRAIREREAVAGSMGVDAAYYKAWALVVSGAIGGVGGAMLAVTTGFAIPQNWDLALTIQYLTIVIVGGMGTLRGTVLGALFVVGLPAVLRSTLGAGASVAGVSFALAQELCYGAAIVVFLLVAPGGLAELIDRGVRRVRTISVRRSRG